MTPQMMLAVPNTSVLGQMNPSFCYGSHMSGMFVNIHACTPSCTVPPMSVAKICAQNIARGLGAVSAEAARETPVGGLTESSCSGRA